MVSAVCAETGSHCGLSSSTIRITETMIPMMFLACFMVRSLP